MVNGATVLLLDNLSHPKRNTIAMEPIANGWRMDAVWKKSSTWSRSSPKYGVDEVVVPSDDAMVRGVGVLVEFGRGQYQSLSECEHERVWIETQLIAKPELLTVIPGVRGVSV
jgi:hypothetical protein